MSTSSKLKTKPSYYKPLPFHGVRAFSALSSIIVTAILLFFCIELKNEKYKIPWTFLIILVASFFTLIWLLITSFIHCCGRLSPLFNMFLNIPLFIVWLVGSVLLTWGIYGTLGHSCTKINWGDSDGILICQHYKALYAFVIFGTISQVALIVLDVRARVEQNRSGKYAKMEDVKLEPFDSTHNLTNSVHDAPYTIQTNDATYRDEPGWRPGQRTNDYSTQSNADLSRNAAVASSRYTDYGDIAGRDGQAQFRMGQFDGQHAPAYHAGYDGGYNSNNNSGNVYGQRY